MVRVECGPRGDRRRERRDGRLDHVAASLQEARERRHGSGMGGHHEPTLQVEEARGVRHRRDVHVQELRKGAAEEAVD